MTLAISICEKVWPTKNKMGFHVVITDNNRPDLGVGAQEVINVTKVKSVAAGGSPTANDRDEVMREIQEVIDSYKVERVQFDIPAYETAASYVQANLNTT
jgi:hypothetical protein